MSLEKQTDITSIEVTISGIVVVKYSNKIVEDEIVLSSFETDKAIFPGDDYSQEDARVKSICAAAHTTEVVAAYQEHFDSLNPKIVAQVVED